LIKNVILLLIAINLMSSGRVLR